MARALGGKRQCDKGKPCGATCIERKDKCLKDAGLDVAKSLTLARDSVKAPTVYKIAKSAEPQARPAQLHARRVLTALGQEQGLIKTNGLLNEKDIKWGSILGSGVTMVGSGDFGSFASISSYKLKAMADAYRAGGGDAARAKSKDTKKVIASGKKALEAAAKAGGGSVRRGQDILADPIGASKRSTLEAGGGEAMVAKVSQAMSKSLGRKLTDKEMENVRAKVAGRGVENLNKLYKSGGGDKALSSGKSVDEIIEEGKKNIDKYMARDEESANRFGKPLTPQERASYKAGGGDAAARKNKGGVDEVIYEGNKVLENQKGKKRQETVQSTRNKLDKGSQFA
jgi:hypothetical protein